MAVEARIGGHPEAGGAVVDSGSGSVDGKPRCRMRPEAAVTAVSGGGTVEVREMVEL